jgi:hypothetical protein
MAMHGPAVGRSAGLVLCVLALAAALAPSARADEPALTVTNLGQSTAPVEVGQPPLGVYSRGGCAHPFTIANESACPPGAWPGLGKPSWAQGDVWSPTESVAGGDTLLLAFSAPMTAVSVGSTSDYEPGLHDPDGKAIPNYDVVPESPAASTPDPAAWQVTLPALDYRAISGYTFSVAGEDGSGFHDYAFEIRSPRYANESTRCGTAYYSTGRQQGLCLKYAIGSPPPQILRVAAAIYDGRVLTLKLDVPGAGTLSLGIPTTCREGRAANCHRKVSVDRRVSRKGRLRIRKPMALRLGASKKMFIAARFVMPDGLIISTLRTRVHFVPPSR